jgi:PKD repeat protein
LDNIAKFSWDFNGDGFYDQETTTNSVSYKYRISGELHPKVKVTYK